MNTQWKLVEETCTIEQLKNKSSQFKEDVTAAELVSNWDDSFSTAELPPTPSV